MPFYTFFERSLGIVFKAIKLHFLEKLSKVTPTLYQYVKVCTKIERYWCPIQLEFMNQVQFLLI